MKRKEKKNYLSDLLIRKRNYSNTTCHYIYIYIYILESLVSCHSSSVIVWGIF